jgi:hypothetical protein
VPRDNGLAANEETDMWNKILQDLRKAKEKNDKQKVVAEEIAALNEQIGRDGGSKLISSPFLRLSLVGLQYCGLLLYPFCIGVKETVNCSIDSPLLLCPRVL